MAGVGALVLALILATGSRGTLSGSSSSGSGRSTDIVPSPTRPPSTTSSSPTPGSTSTTTTTSIPTIQNVSFFTLCGAPGTTSYAGSCCSDCSIGAGASSDPEGGPPPFSYVLNGGSAQYSSFAEVIQLTLTTCSSITVSFLTKEGNFGVPDPGALGYLQVYNGTSTTSPYSEPINTIQTVTIPVTGRTVSIYVSSTDGPEPPVADGAYEVVYVNGSANCTTSNGQ